MTGIQLVAFVISMLISFLPPVSSDQSTDAPHLSPSSLVRRLSDVALKKVVDFGPRYPTEFRTTMQSRPDLRTRLERAVVKQQETAASQAAASTANRSQAADSQRKSGQASKASIKLKMDFSNFSSSS